MNCELGTSSVNVQLRSLRERERGREERVKMAGLTL